MCTRIDPIGHIRLGLLHCASTLCVMMVNSTTLTTSEFLAKEVHNHFMKIKGWTVSGETSVNQQRTYGYQVVIAVTSCHFSFQFIIKDGKGNSIRILPPLAVPYQDGIPCSAVMLDDKRTTRTELLTPIVRSKDLT